AGDAGVAPFTVIVTAVDVVAAVALSVAFAVSVYVPAGTLLHVKPYGAVVSLPITVTPERKSTWATVPSESDAVAASAIVAGAVNVAPFAGLVSATAGGWFPAGFTVIVTAADVVVAVALSV